MKRKSIILLFVILISIIINFTIVTTQAVSGVESKLNSLRIKYPDGAFWNHYGSNNPDGYTWNPCQTHAGNGSPDCNSFEGSIQCDGYARKIFYDIFGQYTRSLQQRTDKNNVQIGDYVRLNIGHSGVVLTKSGNYITLAEANVGNTPSTYCRIKWGSITYNISQISYFIHASNYNSINVAKPSKSTLNVNSSNNTIPVKFTWNATANTHHYDLRIFKSGASEAFFYKKDITSNSFSYTLPAGNYYANVASVGSDRNNYTFSNNVSFTVKQAIPQPGKPTLKVVPGTASYKTTFSWNTTTNTDYYAIRIYKSGSTDEYKLISNIKGNSYSLVLPAGSYYAKVNSSNSTYKTYTFSGNVNFNVMKTPTKSSDGWYYVDQLPSYVNGSNYTIQYKNIIQKVSKTSPGSGYVKGALEKSQYENKGSTYWSRIELPTSKTRVLVYYDYYHCCGANAGGYSNYELGGNFVHEDRITDINSVYVDYTIPDGDYKAYVLKWKSNNQTVYCQSGVTCDGAYGTHGKRGYTWYRNNQYQDKQLVNYYKYTKTSGWVNSKDSTATTVKYRYKPKAKIAISKTTATVKNATYTGKQIKPSITVKYNGKTLKNGTDYTLSYGTNKSTGKATVKITGKGNYTGSVTKTFYIVPKKVTISSAKSTAKKKLTVKYKKVTGASGYQIAYQKSGSKSWTYTTVSSSTASKTLTKLTSKKNYKVRVRAYKTVSGKKYYGTYSATKTVKVK